LGNVINFQCIQCHMHGNNMQDCVVYFTVLSSKIVAYLEVMFILWTLIPHSALHCREESSVTGSGLGTCTGID